MPIVDEKYVSPTWSNDSGTKINASEMQAITDTIEKNQNEKADKTELASGLATKADKTELASGLATKADKTELASGLAVKADKTALAATDKRLNYLYELTQGQAWDTEAGTTPAYTQTVPSGAVAAEIGSIGGKTVVWNQYVFNGDFSDGTNGWLAFSAGPLTVQDGVASVTVVSSAYYYNSQIVIEPAKYPKFPAGHKAYVSAEFYFPVETTVNGYVFGKRDWGITIPQNTWTKAGIIINCDGSNFGYLCGSTIPEVGSVWKYRKVVCVDLTQMFGAGNEPSSTSDPRIAAIIAYAEQNPEYNAGSLLSAAVTDIVSRHKTAEWNQRRYYNNGTNQGIYCEDKGSYVHVYGTTARNNGLSICHADPTSKADIVLTGGHKHLLGVSVTRGELPSDIYIYWRGIPTNVRTVWHTVYTPEANIATRCIISFQKETVPVGTEIDVDVVINCIDLTQMFGAGNEPADTSDPRIAAVEAYATLHPEYNAGQTIGQTVIDGQIVLVQSPIIDTLVIPAAVRALEGYGQSEVGGDGNVLNLADGTFTQVGHYVDDVWTLLAEPVVTDVSGLIPGNMLTVEAGGSLTFVQDGGAELEVPNDTNYFVKLSEAV